MILSTKARPNPRLAWLVSRPPLPCGCRLPFGLCAEGQRLFNAETAARNDLLADGRNPTVQLAYQAARQAYDQHIGLNSEEGSQP